MTLEYLVSYIKKEHRRLLDFYSLKENSKLKYPIVVKIMEELGELCEAVLFCDSIQRKEKLQNKKIDIADEIMDVIITTLLLAENFGIDIKKELQKSIAKREGRNYWADV